MIERKSRRQTGSEKLMPRMARIVVEGMPHHITQRGNMREDVFLCEQDFQIYKELLARYARTYERV